MLNRCKFATKIVTLQKNKSNRYVCNMRDNMVIMRHLRRNDWK